MSAPDDGGPAFPMHQRDDGLRGMSLRDWFAGQALSGISSPHCDYTQGAATRAYQLADAMIAERSSKPTP